MRARRRGTTLVELLVTVAFLALAVAPLLALINSSQKRANDTRQRMLALGIAQDQIEGLKSSARAGGLSNSTNNFTLTPTGALQTFDVKVKVQRVAPFRDIYDASVEVAYNDKGYKVSLATRLRS